MKICPACSETFESYFRFCPIDGSILDQAKSRETYGYSPTLISDLPSSPRSAGALQISTYREVESVQGLPSLTFYPQEHEAELSF